MCCSPTYMLRHERAATVGRPRFPVHLAGTIAARQQCVGNRPVQLPFAALGGRRCRVRLGAGLRDKRQQQRERADADVTQTYPYDAVKRRRDHERVRWRGAAGEEGGAGPDSDGIRLQRHGAIGGGVRVQPSGRRRDDLPDGEPPGKHAGGDEHDGLRGGQPSDNVFHNPNRRR